MKLILTFLIISSFTNLLFGQKSKTSSAVSNKIFISINKEAPKPPYLEIKNYSFLDADGNKKINAGESSSISFDLFNTGIGPGLGLIVSVQEKNNISGLNFSGALSWELPTNVQHGFTVQRSSEYQQTMIKSYEDIIIKV